MLLNIINRLVQSVFVMLAVAFMSFAIFRYVGDPVAVLTGPETPEIDVERIRESLGLNDSFLTQFLRFTGNAIQGDFGLSYVHRSPVIDLLWERLPATLELSLAAALLSLLIGIPLGVYTAIKRTGFLSNIAMAVSLVGVSLPTFFIGIILILVFGVMLQWLPTFGRGETVDIGGWSTGLLTSSGRQALILPAITLSLFQMALIMRLVRAEMLEVLRMDFVRFARARGLGRKSIYFRHALQNTLIPVITILGLQLGSIIAFAIITESVFQWPGMGLLFVQSISNADIPVMSAYLFLIAFLFVVINFIVDLLYLLVDPRMRISASGKS